MHWENSSQASCCCPVLSWRIALASVLVHFLDRQLQKFLLFHVSYLSVNLDQRVLVSAYSQGFSWPAGLIAAWDVSLWD